MKKLFDLIEIITETNDQESDSVGLFEILKSNEKALKLICQAIYEARADYEHIKKFF